MIEYFDYRWKFYRGHAFTDEFDKVYCNIPPYVLDKIKKTHVYIDMIECYSL